MTAAAYVVEAIGIGVVAYRMVRGWSNLWHLLEAYLGFLVVLSFGLGAHGQKVDFPDLSNAMASLGLGTFYWYGLSGPEFWRRVRAPRQPTRFERFLISHRVTLMILELILALALVFAWRREGRRLLMPIGQAILVAAFVAGLILQIIFIRAWKSLPSPIGHEAEGPQSLEGGTEGDDRGS